jgi:protein-tyrosine phosphatase
VLTRRCPKNHLHKLSLFLEDAPLPDPYYGEADGFETVLDLVERRAIELAEQLGSNR